MRLVVDGNVFSHWKRIAGRNGGSNIKTFFCTSIVSKTLLNYAMEGVIVCIFFIYGEKYHNRTFFSIYSSSTPEINGSLGLI